MRLRHVSHRAVEHRPGGIAGIGTAVHRDAAFRWHAPLFAAWIAQLANYALITVLTVMVAALLLHIVDSYAAQTAARGGAILTVDALNMMLIALLVFLVMRQVMPIASGTGRRRFADLLRRCEPSFPGPLELH